MDEKLEIIKNEITEYLHNGGKLSVPAKSLPFYQKINAYRNYYYKNTGKRISMCEIFELCGYIYDRKYYEFLELQQRISELADENNYVDKIKKERSGKDTIMTYLKSFAGKYNCNYSDYLYVMTGYKLKKVNAKVSYIDQLKKELEQSYPNHYVYGIRRDNPELYNKIRHIQKYSTEFETKKDVIEYLGFSNERFLDHSYADYNKKDIIKELNNLYPDKNVSKISIEHNQLYFKISRYAAKKCKTMQQFFEENGFIYHRATLISRLTNTYIDARAYYEDLDQKLTEYYKNKQTKNLTDYRKYQLKFNAFLATCANVELTNNHYYQI